LVSQSVRLPVHKGNLPERKRCSTSQAGTLTKLESETREHPRTSNSFSLCDLFKILSTELSSIIGIEQIPLITLPATLSSSKAGKPGDATYGKI